jgi:negative regulator of flagellin synthesis FlgM
MQISNHFSVSSVASTPGAARSNAPERSGVASPAAGLNPVDQLDLSSEAQSVLASEAGSEGMRLDKIASIREQIAAGTYDTDEKFSAALERMLNAVG